MTLLCSNALFSFFFLFFQKYPSETLKSRLYFPENVFLICYCLPSYLLECFVCIPCPNWTKFRCALGVTPTNYRTRNLIHRLCIGFVVIKDTPGHLRHLYGNHRDNTRPVGHLYCPGITRNLLSSIKSLRPGISNTPELYVLRQPNKFHQLFFFLGTVLILSALILWEVGYLRMTLIHIWIIWKTSRYLEYLHETCRQLIKLTGDVCFSSRCWKAGSLRPLQMTRLLDSGLTWINRNIYIGVWVPAFWTVSRSCLP